MFWIVATHARCRQILDAAVPGGGGAEEFASAVAELLGIGGAKDLRRRVRAAVALLPQVRAAAASIGGFRWEPDARWSCSPPP